MACLHQRSRNSLLAGLVRNLSLCCCALRRNLLLFGNRQSHTDFLLVLPLDVYSFRSRVINIWNSLPDFVVEADSINSFKNQSDKYWTNRDVIYNYECDLTGTGGLPVCM